MAKKGFKRGFLVFLLGMLGLVQSAFAGGSTDVPVFIDPITYLYVTVAIIVLVTLYIVLGGDKKIQHKKSKKLKSFLFYVITIPVLVSSLYLAGFTVYENVVSVTKGPVHWHFDYEVHACGEKLDLVNPKGLSNKIGTPVLHEHNDDRAHVEGVVMDYQDVSLGTYFYVLGGRLTSDSMAYPVEGAGLKEYTNGDTCPDGSVGTLKVFVNGQRVEDPAKYVMYHHIHVPPGDCIMFEFSAGDAQTTDRLCASWEVKEWGYDNFEQKREEFIG